MTLAAAARLRAGLGHVRTVQPNRAADFRRPPFGEEKNLRIAKMFSSFALRLFRIDPSPFNAVLICLNTV